MYSPSLIVDISILFISYEETSSKGKNSKFFVENLLLEICLLFVSKAVFVPRYLVPVMYDTGLLLGPQPRPEKPEQRGKSVRCCDFLRV